MGAFQHFILMPIIRAVEKAREAKETQINDRHLELINALKDIPATLRVKLEIGV